MFWSENKMSKIFYTAIVTNQKGLFRMWHKWNDTNVVDHTKSKS